MAEASANSLARSLASAERLDVQGGIDLYFSSDHRDGRADGCTMSALCGDAARQSDELKRAFAYGIDRMLQTPIEKYPAVEEAVLGDTRAKLIDVLAHAVGAIMLSRACPDDSLLADKILRFATLG